MTEAPEPELARERIKAELATRVTGERRGALVVNTKSRRGQATYRKAKSLLEARGFELTMAFPVRDPTRMPEIVAQCVAEGHALVIVGGGDGSISAVTESFADKPVVLGLLPLGTANSFARTLGIPLEIKGAVDVIADGQVIDVDLGRINGRCFANAAAIGLQPAIARAAPHRLKKIAGRIGYLFVAAAIATRLKPFAVEIAFADGKHVSFPEALEIRIANGAYKGGVLIAREADVESGDLVIHIVRGRSLSRLAKIWAEIVIGVPPPKDELIVLRGTDFTITTDPPHYVSIDGEAVSQTPIVVGIARQALRIMAPRSQDAMS